MPDTTIKCKGCNTDFIFTEGEESFLREKFGDDFSPPKYCKPCRQARKAEKAKGGEREDRQPPRQNRR